MAGRPKFLKDKPRNDRRSKLLTILNWALPIMLVLAGLQVSAQRFARMTAVGGRYDLGLVGRPVVNERVFGRRLVFFSPIRYAGNVMKITIFDDLTHENDDVAAVAQASLSPALICSVVAVFFAFALLLIRSLFERRLGNLHGTAGWATEEDLKETGLMSNGRELRSLLPSSGVICGQLASAKVAANKKKKALSLKMKKGGEAPLVCHEGKANTLLMAQTGHGKGVGVIIPTLLSYLSSMVIYDPKGENFSLTAGFRRIFSRVIKFAPLDMDSAGYNPVAAIKDDISAFAEADFISSVFFPAGDEGSKDNSDFFNQSAKDILTTLILHMRFSDRPDEEKSLYGCYKALSSVDVESAAEGGEDNNALKDLFARMLEDEHFLLDRFGEKDKTSAAARSVVEAIELGLKRQVQANPKELASCVKTVFSKMQLFQDPAIARSTSRSDFELEDFIESEEPISLYLVVPYSDIKRIAPVFRLFINLMLHRFSSGTTQFGEQKLKNHCVMLLDEFPTLGKFPAIEENMGVLRGYGVNFLIVCQGLNQIREIYGDKHSFLTHCVTKIIYSPGDVGDAEIFSKMIGKESVEYGKESQSGNIGSSMQNLSHSTQDMGRMLVDADELMRMGGEYALVMESGELPYLAKKVVYYQDGRFVPRLEYAKRHPLKSRMQKIAEAKKAAEERIRKSALGADVSEKIRKAFERIEKEGESWSDDLLDECAGLPSAFAKVAARAARERKWESERSGARLAVCESEAEIDLMFDGDGLDGEDDLARYYDQSAMSAAFRASGAPYEEYVERGYMKAVAGF